jgi:hypothetical protein
MAKRHKIMKYFHCKMEEHSAIILLSQLYRNKERQMSRVFEKNTVRKQYDCRNVGDNKV